MMRIWKWQKASVVGYISQKNHHKGLVKNRWLVKWKQKHNFWLKITAKIHKKIKSMNCIWAGTSHQRGLNDKNQHDNAMCCNKTHTICKWNKTRSLTIFTSFPWLKIYSFTRINYNYLCVDPHVAHPSSLSLELFLFFCWTNRCSFSPLSPPPPSSDRLTFIEEDCWSGEKLMALGSSTSAIPSEAA